MFKVTLPKDLNEKMKALDELDRSLPEINDAMARNAAFYYRRKIKEKIDAQPENWEPLSKDYLKEKKRKGYDHRIWIARGILRRHLKVVKFGHANYAVTIPPDATYPEGVSIRKVMLINEFGTLDGRVPARPLLRPTRDEVKTRLATEARKGNQRIVQALTKTYNLGGVRAIAPEWLD